MPIQNAMEHVAGRFLRIFTNLPLRGFIHLVSQQAKFTDYFKGFEKNVAVIGIFGKDTAAVLNNLKVDFIWFGYMGVSDDDGHLMVNKRYLSTGRKLDIYLDVVHELCHVKQHMEGRDLFDPNTTTWIDQQKSKDIATPCKKLNGIGLSSAEIRLYLKTEMMSDEVLNRLIRNMGIDLVES